MCSISSTTFIEGHCSIFDDKLRWRVKACPQLDPAILDRLAEYENIKAERRALAALEQPRIPHDSHSSLSLPHTEPHAQPQSRLVGRLPPELRLRICGYVFDRSLEAPYARLGRWRPVFNDGQAFYEEREELDADCFPYRLGLEQDGPDQNLLGLLLSCRQFYIDAISLFYSTFKFVFTSIHDLLSFQLITPSYHLQHIRHLLIVSDGVDCFIDHSFDQSSSATNNSALFDYTSDEIALHRWYEAFQIAQRKMPLLSILNIWLTQNCCTVRQDMPRLPQRPWMTVPDDSGHWPAGLAAIRGQPNDEMTSTLERRHRAFFYIVRDLASPDGARRSRENGKIAQPRIMLDIDWWPEDVLGKRERKGEEDQRSLVVTFKDTKQMRDQIDGLPRPRLESLFG